MCYSHIIPKTSEGQGLRFLCENCCLLMQKPIYKKIPHKHRREHLAFSQSQVINSLGNKFRLNDSVKTTKNIPMFLERFTLIWPVVAGFGRARAGRTRPLKIRLVPGPSIPVVPVEGNALLLQPYKNIQEQHATYNVIPGQWDNSANPCLCDQ